MMFSGAASKGKDGHAEGNDSYPATSLTPPSDNNIQTSGAVSNETSLDTLSPRSSMRHRHRSVPSHEEINAPQMPVLDDADIAAGHFSPRTKRRINKLGGVIGGSETDFLLLSSRASFLASDDEDEMEGAHLSDPEIEIDRGEDMDSADKFLVLGFDISHMSRRSQFLICAFGVFSFSLLYGFLQELISVEIFSRKLGMFLAAAQFSGYAAWSYLLRVFVKINHGSPSQNPSSPNSSPSKNKVADPTNTVPIKMYIGLSLLRAFDLAMTNLAMQYINYPAKTLMKSSRVIWTMMFGVIVLRKRYRMQDYAIVLLMVAGLAIFMHADASNSAVFDVVGIIMLTVSLICDGAVSNMSEAIMSKFAVGQDEFIFHLYSIALVAILAGAVLNGDLLLGFEHLSVPGTVEEIETGQVPTWSVVGKITVLFLFSTTGFLGSSCSAAITKNFGALTMSITSTARKATTLFLSFAFFPNLCTWEHIVGIVLFLLALVGKSLKASKSGSHKKGRSNIRKTSTVQMGATDQSRNDGRHWGDHKGYHVV